MKIYKIYRIAATQEAVDNLKSQMIEYLHSQFPDEGWQDEAEVAIYYFASDWHGGQDSELYSILSTSPYKPGSLSTLASEGDTVNEMYKALEDKFTFKSLNKGISLKVDDAIQNKLELAKLKAKALKACESRGHEMGKWEDLSETISQCTCTICAAQVVVDTKPSPNGIHDFDISGKAVALNCKPQYEIATPEEIEREIGKVSKKNSWIKNASYIPHESGIDGAKKREAILIDAIKQFAQDYNFGHIREPLQIDSRGDIMLVQLMQGIDYLDKPLDPIVNEIAKPYGIIEQSERWLKMNHFSWEKMLGDLGYFIGEKATQEEIEREIGIVSKKAVIIFETKTAMANRWIPQITDPERQLQFEFDCTGIRQHGPEMQIIELLDNNEWHPNEKTQRYLEKQVGALEDDYALRFMYCVFHGRPYIAAYFSAIHYVYSVRL